MASLVGSVGWKAVGRNTSWQLPAGTAVGDVVVAVVVAYLPSVIPPGFTPAVSRGFGARGGGLIGLWIYPHLIISTRTVTAGMSSVGWGDQTPAALGDMAVLVVRGTQGVGVTRTDTQVSVRDGGAAVLLAGGYSAPTVPSGPSWSAPHQSSHPAGSVLHMRWGWQAPAGGGVVGGSVSGGWGLAIELLPPAGPMPPLLTAPDDGVEVTVTAQTPLVLSWRHRPSRSGGSQDAFQLRRTASAQTLYWSAAAGSWSSTPVTNPGAAQSVDLPVGAVPENVPLGWAVRTREALDGTWSDWAPEQTFMRVTPPSVTVTGPAVTVTDDLSPDVTWAPTTPRGSQTAWRVRVAHAVTGVQVWDSGVVAGGARVVTVPASTAWVRGQRYRAAVSVQQTGGSWSPDGNREFTMTWAQPALPTVTLDTDGPGVGVAVSAGAALVVEVQRSTDGAQFVPLATWTGGGKVRDVFATYGLPTRYRARTGTVLDGQRLWSDWVTADPITSTDHCSYISSAVDPVATWQRLFIRADNTRRHVRETAVDYGLGDTRPRVSHGPHRGMAGSMEARTETAADTDALEALLLSGEVLQVRMPPDGRAITGRDLPEIMTVAVAAAPTLDRLAHTALIKGRIIHFEWVEQSPPPLGASMAPASHPIDRTGA